MGKLKDVIGGSGVEGVDGTLEDLQKANGLLLKKVKVTLGDAERRPIREEGLLLWLRDLRNLALEMEDSDDLFQYQLLAMKAEESEEMIVAMAAEESQEVARIERDAASSSSRIFPLKALYNYCLRCFHSDDDDDEVRHHPSFLEEMSDRLNKIQARFDEIAKQKEALNFPITSGQPSHYVDADGSSSMDRQTGFLPVNPGEFVGREQQKKKIVDMLIRIDVNPAVIALVGMGGIGKTTLCQHIFNDSRIKTHFDLRGWVHVGEFFDVKSVINKILGSFTDEDANYSQVSQAQKKLTKQVQGNRLLLVMDDVWCQNIGDWETVLTTLKNMDVKEGCKILVTTRDRQVAEAAKALESIRLHRLSEEDGWSLFCKCANIGMNGNHNSNELVEVGKAIVAKCKGLPLAIKVMGSLMRNKGDDVDGWREIRDNDFSDIKEGRAEILGPLYLSYLNLPSRLKACFKFFHFIPSRQCGSLENYDAKRFIDLWLAYDLIGDENCSFTEQGNSLLDEFESRSFLERVPTERLIGIWYDDRTSSKVKVHDLIFDVAQFALNKETCITDDHKESMSSIPPTDVRHLIIQTEHYLSIGFKRLLPVVEFERCSYSPSSVFYPKLRLLHVYACPHNIQFHFKHLRVLFIEESDMEMIPDSLYKLFNLKNLEFFECNRIRRVSDLIGNLKNLRCLSFNNCWKLEMIPESVSKLTALEELRLYQCRHLEELPDGITTLANLRCLDVQGTAIRCLPVGLSNLRKLRLLPCYPFSDGGFLDRLNCLNSLNVKGHTLSIYVNVSSLQVEESIEVELGIKGQFSFLSIIFDAGFMEFHGRNNEKILQYLKPHSDIRELAIYRYNGARLPLWMCDGSFHQLVHIELWELRWCKSLSPLHQLPSLEKLVIWTCASLEKLVSEVDWGLIPVDNILDSEKKLFFPKLEHLSIYDCNAVEFIPVYQLTALQGLSIYGCENLESIEFVDPSSLLEKLGAGGNLSSLLTELVLWNCPKLCLLTNNYAIPPQSLKTIRMRTGCEKLVDWCRSNPNSKWTDIIQELES